MRYLISVSVIVTGIDAVEMSTRNFHITLFGATMLRTSFVLCLLSVGFAGSVIAQSSTCSCVSGADKLNQNQIAAALGDKTVCAVLGGESWKEFHTGTTTTGGALIETGSTPPENVGTWSVSGNGANAQIVYNYGTGGTYSYDVCTQGTSIHFCGVKNITNATTVAGQGGCGS